VRIRTFEYDHKRWSSRLGGLHIEVRGGRAPREAGGRAAEWAANGFDAHDAVIAHNFPANAILGASSYRGVKVWYCHEPSRTLHPAAATPNLARFVTEHPLALNSVATWYLRRLQVPWLAGRVLRRGPWRRAQEDVHAVKGLDAIWANSAYTRDNVRRIYGLRDVEIVHPFVKFPRAHRSRGGLDRTGLRVLTMTRLEPVKNVATVLRAFASFLRGCPSATLDIVGDGGERRRLERLARTLGVARSVTFHGFLPEQELERVFERCDVFALLPIDEPFGMVFPEAAARGLLLVVPDHGGPSEIVDGGALGRTVDAFDPEAAADALRRVWAMSDAEVDALRERADAACRSRFSRDTIGPRVLELLERA